VADDDGRPGRSAAWGVAAVICAAIAVAAWQQAAGPGSAFPVWPAYAFGVATVATLYMCFATIWRWPPAARPAAGSLNGDLAGLAAAGPQTAPPGQAVASQVVVGEIPREPPNFVLRETLARLAAAAGAGRVAVVCAVTGLRGVGKTQLAAAYARDRIAAGCGLVGWVNAESPDSLLRELARVAEAVGAADPEGDSLESARRLREHLETRLGEALLVFDNAADPDGLGRFLPATGRCQVLVTSADRAFAELGTAVEVGVFSRAESVEYLAARTKQADPDGAAAVADQLGDLPLALSQAAATIHGERLTYARYLERLARIPVADLLGPVRAGGYPRHTAAALLLNVETAEAGDSSGLAGRLLRVMAVLSPDGVRRDLLAGLAADGQAEVDAAVQLCADASLLSWSVTGDVAMMHRLLGRVLRERDRTSGQRDDTITMALDLLEPLLFGEEQAWARREEGTHLAAQAGALRDAALDTTEPGQEAGPPVSGVAVRVLAARLWALCQLRAAADLGRAIELGRQTVADSERVLGPDHPDTLVTRSNLAYAYRAAGRPGDAIPLFERTLADFERVLGADHRDTLTAGGNLAGAYEAVGRLGDAIPLLERTLADCERVLGADHPDTVISRNNLAYGYEEAGRLGEAVPLFERALADRERVLGADHADTLTSRSNLASAYHSAGRLGEATGLHERTLADRERVLGGDHPDTLMSRNNLASVYQEAGRLDEAIPLYERALADCDRVLGAYHPSTLTSRNNLASVYDAAGRLGEAIGLHERTLDDRERIMGADHPDSLPSRNNLAYAYQEAGRLGEATGLYERTLADRERVLGADHPDTLSSRHNLAGVYESAGRLGEAIGLYERTLADRERVLGADHPDTLSSRHNLAGVYESAGRLGEAIGLYERTLADRERVLGPDHAHTLATQNNLANACRAAGRLAEAIGLYERTLAGCERALGPDHPQTLTARDNLDGAQRESRRRRRKARKPQRTSGTGG
jgi:tetratricopeptide (TPR) repeat protein